MPAPFWDPQGELSLWWVVLGSGVDADVGLPLGCLQTISMILMT